ncbi:hypothetical protein QH494_23085 [Sphingomonas sp. AR_OL41]|uniref:hypothetical protein n=1 Tax=Sphingomonas sp. AR_OL41 TaxID=3042729 RepID=UPI0024814B19|nr:hypothetical protein [Sphingomonas sp. AR_OL41]MDH7975079.1 hypothetical protein [Sphingomonas sp. AR_OL41]
MNHIKYSVLFTAILLGSCRDESRTAEQCAALTNEKAFVDRCMGGDRSGSKGVIEETRCFPFSSPMKMSGLWLTAFERSKFFPGAVKFADSMWIDESTWIERSSVYTSDVKTGDGSGPQAAVVEFIGRRSLCLFYYGHLGSYTNEVIIDRLISSRKVPIPPR